MAKSGYAAIGHLLLLGKSHAEKVEILQKICKKVCLRLTSEFVQVDGIKERLNLFFGTVKPTADNFAKFSACFLKKQTVDPYLMELQIERLIWAEISNRVHNGQTFHKEVTDFDTFRCFCIFNRFCDVTIMKIDENTINNLLKRLCIAAKSGLDMHTFLKQVLTNFHETKAAIEKLFNDLVRDVYMEESQMKIRGKNDGNSFTMKTVTITTNHIFMTDQIASRSDEELFLQQISLNSHNLSGTRQQQSVAALVLASNSEISVQKPQQQNLFSKKKTTIITVKTPNIGWIELSFNADLDHYKIYMWTRGLEEALQNKKIKTSKLKTFYEEAEKEANVKKLHTSLDMKKSDL